MEALLIFQQPDDAGWEIISEKLRQVSCFVVVAPGISISGHGISVKALPAGVISKSNKDLLNLILKLGDKNTGGETLSELLNSGHFPIWHYQRFRVYFELRQLFVLRASVAHYLNEGCRVTVYCDPFRSKGLNGYGDNFSLITGPAPRKAGINFGSLFNYLIYFKIRILISLFLPPKLKGKKHLLVDRSLKQPCRNVETMKLKYDNYSLSNLFDKAGSDFLIVSETEQPKVRGKASFRLSSRLFAGLSRRSDTIYSEYILLTGILSLDLQRKKREMNAKLSAGIATLKSLDLNESEALVLGAFIRLAPTNSYYITRFLAYQRFFVKHKFITVTAIDENSPSTRCILDAARSTGARTIGIQHGNIGDAQPAYLYTENDRKNRIMADITLVWGDYWRDFLIQKGNFPADSVKVTGQLRTDVIPKLQAFPDRLKEELAVRKHLAVFASQPIPDPVLRYRAAFDVFSAFAGLPDVELIVKLHPAEKDAIAYYREIAIAAGCDDYRLLYDIDLYGLLAAADLVITCYSTVGTEAIYFGKSLIILDHNKDDLLGYHAAGVAWQAVNAEDLSRLASGILHKKLQPDMESIRRFVERYSYNIDGQATDRTLAIIRAAEYDIVH